MNVDLKTDCEDPLPETVQAWAPPVAPLAMPRQVLEQPRRRGLIDQLAMILFPREHI
ncbi:hypothetical protein [Pseudorhodobacter turbinis]|uniref:hypothetical protein n=1 Tax=Pseudorhodobacter turbinis TaxID=2500533 RepID=UPI00143D9C6C|nr:hypothetical protein [Pseudorhodobacter turbinis]